MKKISTLLLAILFAGLLSYGCSGKYKITQTEPETKVSLPFFYPPGGIYFSEQTVVISCRTGNSTIYYTIDGSEPTESSLQYTQPIVVNEDVKIRARAFKSGLDESSNAYAPYLINRSALVEMVYVEGGTFIPAYSYTVTLSSFYISKYEVTQAEYFDVMGANPSGFPGNFRRPVERVSWFDAIEFCNRLSLLEGLNPCYSYIAGDIDYGRNPDHWPDGWNTDYRKHRNVKCDWLVDGYRLPTEMEHMFAAKGGVPAQKDGTFAHTFPGTNREAELGKYAWFFKNSGGNTHPVGSKLPNELGLFDMGGNVRNWCWDIKRVLYPSGHDIDPTGLVNGTERSLRGGSYDSPATGCRADLYALTGSWATNKYNYFGLRVFKGHP